MPRQIGEVVVDVRANTDEYTRGLQQAERQAQDFNQRTQNTLNQTSQATGGLSGAIGRLANTLQSNNTVMTNWNEGLGFFRNQITSSLGPLSIFLGALGIGGVITAVTSATQAFQAFAKAEWEFSRALAAT